MDRRGEGEKITRSPELDDEHGEARYVAGEIEEPGRPRARSSATRSRSSTGPTPTAECPGGHPSSATSCPYQVIGGTKFYERAEIKDAVAYLNLLVNPADEVSFRASSTPRAGASATPQPGQAALARQHDPGARSGRWRESPRRSRAWVPPRSSR